MKIKNFLALYKTRKTNEAKAELFMQHIQNHYVSITEKQKKAQKVLNRCMYKDGELYVQSVLKYILSCLALVDLYSDLELTAENITEEFDELNKIGFFDAIFQVVNDRELKEFNMVLELEESDTIDNNK